MVGVNAGGALRDNNGGFIEIQRSIEYTPNLYDCQRTCNFSLHGGLLVPCFDGRQEGLSVRRSKGERKDGIQAI